MSSSSRRGEADLSGEGERAFALEELRLRGPVPSAGSAADGSFSVEPSLGGGVATGVAAMDRCGSSGPLAPRGSSRLLDLGRVVGRGLLPSFFAQTPAVHYHSTLATHLTASQSIKDMKPNLRQEARVAEGSCQHHLRLRKSR